ncbi:MAG: phytanoyl-CoA dioxygenase family protein [bacterium]|nr:phytanoyl-CoA dioxygenase family protein [bacterium]
MAEQEYRVAPPGFTRDQWDEFMEQGMLVIEDALTDEECDRYIDMIDAVAARSEKYDPAKFFGPNNIVERYPEFAELIDHPRHIGFMHDVYGELLKIHISQCFLRPRDTNRNKWHPDGARALPYSVFSPEMPIQIKVAYWLTDLPEQEMGNFVYMPGSHKGQYFDFYDTHDNVPGEKILCPRRGTMTFMHCSTWHRVAPNNTDTVRKNIFLAYCPSWVCEADRHQCSPYWLDTLNREQRIIMRSYGTGYARTKPAASEFPLFLDRDTESDRDDGVWPAHVALHRRKRLTAVEKFQMEAVQV